MAQNSDDRSKKKDSKLAKIFRDAERKISAGEENSIEEEGMLRVLRKSLLPTLFNEQDVRDLEERSEIFQILGKDVYDSYRIHAEKGNYQSIPEKTEIKSGKLSINS